MEKNMTEQQVQAECKSTLVDQKIPTANKQKKKASWLRTILWMFSMILLTNIIMAILAYFLFFKNK
jgi:hypothetical protein